ncbi:MAG: hypothetical protein INQ03_10760 [Candidatus Heimdallarchaeota archaeon]|nr:hypothetical protein [Candidatus Heimdallarchaeota archaeon]
MDIKETRLPGVGEKFKCHIEDKVHLVIIRHTTGKVELYLDDNPDQDNIKLFELSAEQAKTVGNLLADNKYVTEKEHVYAQLDKNSILEWYMLEKDNPLIGKTLKQINADDDILVQIIACKSEEHTTTTSLPDHFLKPKEMIIAVGSREDHNHFKKYLGE